MKKDNNMSSSNSSLSANAAAIVPHLENLLKNGELSVPMLPEVAGRVVGLSQDPDSDATQLAQLIQGDQSLAGHVMRIANSAAYSPNGSMVSLQQAITRLGMNLISDIALAASISTKMFDAPGFEEHVSHTWQHALTTALWSKEIARVCRRNVEATFLCGLLHSIGRPVVLQAIIEISRDKGIALSHEDALALEDSYQQGVGASVAEKWDMPKIVCEAIRFFDDYESAPIARDQTCMINGGAQFARHMLKPEALDLDTLIMLPVLADLNLYQDEVARLLDMKEAIASTREAMSA